MNKLLVIPFALLVLSGCSSTLNNWEQQAGITFCADRGGVDYFTTYTAVTNDRVRCANGEQAMIKVP